MYKNRHTRPRELSLCFICLMLLLGACSPALPTPAQTSVEELQTQAAMTVIALVTQEAIQNPSATPTITPESSNTPPPTETIQPSETPTPSHTPEPLITQPSFTVILQDNFNEQGAWAEQNSENFGFGYLEDGYGIYVNILNAAIWSIRGPEQITNARIEADARRYSGPVNGYYGVICRHSDADNYYALMVSDDLSFGIARMENGKFVFLAESQDTQNIIKPGETNRISAECVNEQITLFVNGQTMMSVNDSTHQSGAAGLVAKTRLNGEFQAIFKSFSIATP
jgi:hypothetical protein